MLKKNKNTLKITTNILVVWIILLANKHKYSLIRVEDNSVYVIANLKVSIGVYAVIMF